MAESSSALIVGAGFGLSAALARLLTQEGFRVGLASRNVDKLAPLVGDIGGHAYVCDASRAGDVAKLFDAFVKDFGIPEIVVYNASRRIRGSITELEPAEVEKAILTTCFGGFLVAQAAARLMLARGSGSILLTGASAGVKGYANSSTFAMGKFGLRGLAQSLARELAPKNIHVAHFVIDGGIRQPGDARAEARGPDGMLDPDAIAATYLNIHRQHRSAWTWEVELRPWVENF